MSRLLFSFILLLADCGGGDSPGDPDAAGGTDATTADSGPGADGTSSPDGGGGEPIFEVPPASIQIIESSWQTGETYGDIRGGVWNTPPAFHREVAREGFCRLLTYDQGFCGECDFDEICMPSGDCEPYPTALSAGTITVTGLKTVITLSLMGSYYWPDQSPIPADLFDAGDSISANSPGDVFPAFDLGTTAAPLATVALTGDEQDEMRLVDGAPFTVTWNPTDPGSRVRLELKTPSAGGHGTPSAAIIECDAPNSGSLVIAQSLIEAFPEQGRLEICVAKDCPPSTFLHYRRGVQDTASGRVEILVGTRSYFLLLHEVE